MIWDIRRCREVADLVHGGVLMASGAGGLHAVPGQVVMRRQRRVQRETRAHTAQPGLVVSENINILDIPDQKCGQRKCKVVPELREVVFVQAHGRALGPEEVLGELVGDEAHGEAVAVT